MFNILLLTMHINFILLNLVQKEYYYYCIIFNYQSKSKFQTVYINETHLRFT